MYKLFLITLFLFSVAFGSFVLSNQMVSAQPTLGSTKAETEIVFEINPNFPRPNEDVTISAESYFLDLSRSATAWYVNGEKKTEGYAIKEFKVKAGALGVQTKVTLIAVEGKRRIIQDVYFTPAEVELVWEANTYVPPLLKAKAAYTSQSDITAIALPNLKGYKASELIYKWTRDGDVIEKGRGLQRITIPGDIIVRPFIVSVEVESADYKQKAFATATFSPNFPEILMYKKSNTQGTLYENAISNDYETTDSEFTFGAFPYGFSTTNRFQSDVNKTWSVNGKIDQANNNKNDLTFRRTSPGKIAINITAKAVSRLLQFANKGVTINLKELK